jgi:hypothetical protein
MAGENTNPREEESVFDLPEAALLTPLNIPIRNAGAPHPQEGVVRHEVKWEEPRAHRAGVLGIVAWCAGAIGWSLYNQHLQNGIGALIFTLIMVVFGPVFIFGNIFALVFGASALKGIRKENTKGAGWAFVGTSLGALAIIGLMVGGIAYQIVQK